MDFSVFSLAPVPDIAAARRLYPFDGLERSAIAKALAHQRRQASGDESLRWDQCAIGAACVIHHQDGRAMVDAWEADGDSDADLVRTLTGALIGQTSLMTWDPTGQALAVLRCRVVAHQLELPGVWTEDRLLDLQRAFGGAAPTAPSLDQLAGQLGLPAPGGTDRNRTIQHWLDGDAEVLRMDVVCHAVQSYLLAGRIMHARGTLGKGELCMGMQELSRWLEQQRDPGNSLADLAAQLTGAA
jgi:hypothetical protein